MTDKIAISYLKTRRKEVSGYKRHWLFSLQKNNQKKEYRTFENHRFPRITSTEVDQDL